MCIFDLLTILISKVPSHHFHLTLVIGSMSADPAHTQGEGITEDVDTGWGRGGGGGGRDNWKPF